MFFELGTSQPPSVLSLRLLPVLVDALEREPAEMWSSARQGARLSQALRDVLVESRAAVDHDSSGFAEKLASDLKEIVSGWSSCVRGGGLIEVSRVESMTYTALLAMQNGAAAERDGDLDLAWRYLVSAALATGAAMVPAPDTEMLLVRHKSSWGRSAQKSGYEGSEEWIKRGQAELLWNEWQRDGQKTIPAVFYRRLIDLGLAGCEKTAARWDKSWRRKREADAKSSNRR